MTGLGDMDMLRKITEKVYCTANIAMLSAKVKNYFIL